MKIRTLALLPALVFGLGSLTAQSQDLHIPAPSPTQFTHQAFAMSYIDILYSRPGMKGRKIFGDLVPFGQVWRTGANASTKLSFGEDVELNGHPVARGKYALYTVPGPEKWTIILNHDTTLDGAMGYASVKDLLRFEVPVSHLTRPVETFTMEISQVQPDQASVDIRWEKTQVSFTVSANIDSAIMAQINAAMQGNEKPYFAAASYYFDNHKDTHQALAWVNAAIEQNQQAYYMYYLKARILASLGSKREAEAVSRQSIVLAEKAGNPDYVRLNEKLIASLNVQTK